MLRKQTCSSALWLSEGKANLERWTWAEREVESAAHNFLMFCVAMYRYFLWVKRNCFWAMEAVLHVQIFYPEKRILSCKMARGKMGGRFAFDLGSTIKKLQVITWRTCVCRAVNKRSSICKASTQRSYWPSVLYREEAISKERMKTTTTKKKVKINHKQINKQKLSLYFSLFLISNL